MQANRGVPKSRHKPYASNPKFHRSKRDSSKSRKEPSRTFDVKDFHRKQCSQIWYHDSTIGIYVAPGTGLPLLDVCNAAQARGLERYITGDPQGR
jgi:hypothetical protein